MDIVSFKICDIFSSLSKDYFYSKLLLQYPIFFIFISGGEWLKFYFLSLKFNFTFQISSRSWWHEVQFSPLQGISIYDMSNLNWYISACYSPFYVLYCR